MTTGELFSRRILVVFLALGLAASACTGSATVTQTGSASDQDGAEPTVVNAERAPVDATEPTAEPATAPSATAVPTAETVEPTSSPVPAPATPQAAADFRADAVLGITNDGTHAYAGTTSFWQEPTPCDAVPSESLSVVTIAEAAASGEVSGAAAGLEQAGDVRQLLNGPGSTAAVLSSCGSNEDAMLWLNRVDFGADGRISKVGERLDVGADNESDPYLLHWIDNDTVEVRVIVEVDPDDAATWIGERRQISLTTGQIVRTEQFDYFSEDAFKNRAALTTPDGFTYSVTDDPAGGLGCEGFGVARTIELDDGTERRLALTQPNLVFSDVSNLHMIPRGYIAWTSGCEGFTNAFVGKVLDDGSIADAHLVETYSLGGSEFADYQFFRLTDDGFLAAVGQSFGVSDDANLPHFLHYDLRADPHFINTADPGPEITTEPLFEAAGGDGSWHLGETLSLAPACGGQTLYGKTPGGFVRALPLGQEIDEIVDVDLGETRTLTYSQGDDYVSRTVVVQTECPGSYEGRRVWFGVETENIIWGLGLQQADLGEVADVLAVQDVLQDGTDFVERTIVQVELLDGSVADVELVGLPFGG